MVSRRGFGVISLLAMTCCIWALVGLLETSTPFSTALGEPIGAELSRSGWSRGDVVHAAVALSLLPYPDPREPRFPQEEFRAPSLGTMYGALPSARNFVRGRPVAEPPTWFILSVAAGGLLARRRSLHA